jgi:hypothetical protein
MKRSEAKRTVRTDAKLKDMLTRVHPDVAALLVKQEDEVIAHCQNPEHFELLCDRIADANTALAGLPFTDRRLIIKILIETTDTLEGSYGSNSNDGTVPKPLD